MNNCMFHVFRNTPFGRDTFLQSIYFAKKVGVPLTVYIPKHSQFLMYFPERIVTIDLDSEFLNDPSTARDRAQALIDAHGVEASFFEPKDFTAPSLPDVRVNFEYMCCPRSVSDLTTKIGLGYIGPKVRQIVQNSVFPVLIPTPVFKPWDRITVFFGGSETSIRAVRLAQSIQATTGCSLTVFTRAEKRSQAEYEQLLETNQIPSLQAAPKTKWQFFDEGEFEQLLYHVPSGALLIAGAYGHGVIKELLFGSKIEKIQTILPNNMLLVGPRCFTA